MPDPGEVYARDSRYYIKPHTGEKMIVTDPQRDTVTGDILSRDTTITVTPDPDGWSVIGGELIRK